MTTKFLQTALLRAQSKKGKKQNGFTLVELMVVIVIVGILSAVALPALNGAKERAFSSTAKQQAVQYAKACSIEILGDGTAANADIAADLDTDGDVTNLAATCAEDETYSFTGGGDTWTVTLVEGVPGAPTK